LLDKLFTFYKQVYRKYVHDIDKYKDGKCAEDLTTECKENVVLDFNCVFSDVLFAWRIT